MSIKEINDTASLNNLVLIFLVFGAYFYISKFNSPIFIISQYIIAIKNAMKKVQKIRAGR